MRSKNNFPTWLEVLHDGLKEHEVTETTEEQFSVPSVFSVSKNSPMHPHFAQAENRFQKKVALQFDLFNSLKLSDDASGLMQPGANLI